MNRAQHEPPQRAETDAKTVWVRHDELQDGMIIIICGCEFRVSEVRRTAEVTLYRANCTEAAVNGPIRGLDWNGVQWTSFNSQLVKIRMETEP